MNVRELLSELKGRNLSLSSSYELISHLLKIPYKEAKAIPSDTPIADAKVKSVLKKLDKHTPVSYITNSREFYGYDLFITKDVLIPRVETEILIDVAKEIIVKEGIVDVADLFTGSGAITVALVNEVAGIYCVGADISMPALKVAKINCDRFQLKGRADLIRADLSNKTYLNYFIENFEMIVANPPYISAEDYLALELEVKQEPKIALISKDCGLFYYNMLLCQSSFIKGKLRYLVMEIGYNQREAISKIADKFSLNSRFVKDYNGNDRVVVITL